MIRPRECKGKCDLNNIERKKKREMWERFGQTLLCQKESAQKCTKIDCSFGFKRANERKENGMI